MRTDNGGEYTSNEFSKYCSAEGIKKEHIVPHTLQQNGVAERKNKTLAVAAKAMLFDQGLPLFLWAEAYRFAVYIQTGVPTQLCGGRHLRRSSQELDQM